MIRGWYALNRPFGATVLFLEVGSLYFDESVTLLTDSATLQFLPVV